MWFVTRNVNFALIRLWLTSSFCSLEFCVVQFYSVIGAYDAINYVSSSCLILNLKNNLIH